jgi:uncharacterized membrane protein
LLGVFFRFYHLDRKVFWEDEIAGTVRALGYTEAGIVAASPDLRDARSLQMYFHLPPPGSRHADRLANTVGALAAEDPQHPPLYYLASHLWIERFGSTVAAMRALPALFGVLVLPCAYFLALELFGSVVVAWLAVALLAVSPFEVLYAQEAREYSLWAVAILLICLTFLRARRSMSVAAWSLYAVTLAAGMYVFPFSALVAMGQGLFLFVADRGKPVRGLVAYGAASGIAALAFAPWLAIMLTNRALERGMGNILVSRLSAPAIAREFTKNVRENFIDLGASGGFVFNTFLAVIAAALCCYALFYLARHGPRDASTFVLLAFGAPAVPLVASDLLGRGMLVYQSRYFTPLYLGLDFAVAFLFAAKIAQARATSRDRLLWQSLFGGVLACGIVSCLNSSQAETWWNKDYEQSRAVASIVNASAAPLVVADDRASRTLGLGYYLDPRVKLDLKLACDNCDQAAIVASAPSAAAPPSEHVGDVFLLGRTEAPQGAHVHRIDTDVYPRIRAPLSMFLRP